MHRASMNTRLILSCANSSKTPQHSSPASRFIGRTHVSFGLPLPLLPWACQPGVTCPISHSFLETCPSHFHRANLTHSCAGCTPEISLSKPIVRNARPLFNPISLSVLYFQKSKKYLMLLHYTTKKNANGGRTKKAFSYFRWVTIKSISD